MKSLSRKIDKIEESQTIAITSLAKKLRAEGKDIISLSAGEPDFPTPEHVKQAAISAIRDNFTKYTQNEGTPELRDAIANKLRTENGIEVKASSVLVCNGGKHAIFNALQAICNPGDEVIIPSPYWVSFPEMVKLADATPIIMMTSETDDFTFTADDLLPLITQKTKALIINSPNNPTGSVMREKDLRDIAMLALERDFFIISDEIYEKIIYDGNTHFSIGSIPEVRDRVITASGVSKAYSMTGWRIGFLAAPEEVISRAAKVQSQMTSNASSISQAAALEALRGDQTEVEKMRIAFERRRNVLIEKLSGIEGVSVCKPAGAFYLFPSLKGIFGKKYDGQTIKDSFDASKFLLAKAETAVVPGAAFGSHDHVRISYAYAEKDLIEAARRIASAISDLV